MKSIIVLFMFLSVFAYSQPEYVLRVELFPKDFVGVGYQVYVKGKVYSENIYTRNPAVADTLMREKFGLVTDTKRILDKTLYYDHKDNDWWIYVEKKMVYRKPSGKIKYKKWKD